MSSGSSQTSRSVSRELNPETARRLRSLEQSMERLTGQFQDLQGRVNLMGTPTPPKSNKLNVTGTQAFLLRNQT